MSQQTVVARRLVVRGVVQGVGFRPHLARLAAELGLSGWCRNDATCVVVEIEGPAGQVDRFESRLAREAPPLARVQAVSATTIAVAGASGFRITESTAGSGARTLAPADSAVCADCLAELADPGDRRYRHPFITCTNCGPRFTITTDLPYDRPATTMAPFAMCPACRAEYADPTDRRFHAQPIGCHDCGPRLRILTSDGAESLPPEPGRRAAAEHALGVVRAALAGGAIVAIKGLGGYHLACDAADDAAVERLRARKHRPEQPFAVMAADLATGRRLVDLPEEAIPVLTGPERPIVLLPRRRDAPVSASVAPGLDDLGVLLPYTPLHQLLFGGSGQVPPVLVMTSGNRSGEPICYTDTDAVARLGGIADLFCAHDREIAVPCDDSVLAWSRSGPIPVRRSRGYAPLPIPLDGDSADMVLAAGAEIKNTFALARNGWAFVSAHVGDLGTTESRAAYGEATGQLLRFHRAAPALVVTDRHPGYASRAWAGQFADDLGVPTYEVFHHHAHLAALAAEHGRLDEPILGVVYDGTGYGCDATVWGGELLLLGDEGLTAERCAHLGTVRLPGGDAGVRNPVRTAALALLAAGESLAGTPLADALTEAERTMLTGLRTTGWVPTSSVGRLFDVVSALLGIRPRISYEAQAAIELEAVATAWSLTDPGDPVSLRLPVVDLVLEPEPLIIDLVAAVRAGRPTGALALAFHDALATATATAASAVARARGVTVVGLTGGVFVNRLLLARVTHLLEAAGLEVLTHRTVPPNDGGLALGQVALGVRRLTRAAAERSR